MKRIRVTTILGTRPELIRLSEIIKRFDILFEHRLVHTGQNSDEKLSNVFLQELSIRDPDLSLNLPNDSIGKFFGGLFTSIEKEFETNNPDAVVILGDTNSALSGIIAKRKGIPVYHLEAGNRAFDENVPEEINRKIVDHFSDYNLAYTENSKNNLIREGLHPRTSVVIGSPLNEVINCNLEKINSSKILGDLKIKSGRFFLASFHRQENVDDLERLIELLDALNAIAIQFDLPIVITVHPRTRNKLDLINFKLDSRLQFHPPFGFIDYCKLQKESRIVFSDSGSVSEEAAILGFKAITVRDSMERPEAVECGSVIMSGLTKDGILNAIHTIEFNGDSKIPPSEYFIPDSSLRVTSFIASTLYQHSFWSGRRKPRNTDANL